MNELETILCNPSMSIYKNGGCKQQSMQYKNMDENT